MRRALSTVGATVALGLVAPVAPASAGGGCHREAQTHSRGAIVELRDMCMNPSVLLTAHGTTVTFANRDAMEHNVFGEGWAIASLPAGATKTHTFETEGTFAFVCTLHPGMVGAVTVGDGLGDARVADVDRAVPAATNSATDNGDDRLGLGLALGAALGLGAALAAPRLRSRIR